MSEYKFEIGEYVSLICDKDKHKYVVVGILMVERGFYQYYISSGKESFYVYENEIKIMDKKKKK